MEKSKLRSSGARKCFFGFLFIYENDLVALGRKSLVKKKVDSHLGDDIRLRKKIERTWA